MFDKEKTAEIKRSLEAWEQKNIDTFAKELPIKFTTEHDEIPIKRLYTPLDLEERGFDYNRDLGFPGDPPFTRGITPTMYRSNLLSALKFAGFATARETNTFYKMLLKEMPKGSMLAIALDLPTQMGYDPDHPMAHGEVGKVGVSVASLRDFEDCFDGIEVANYCISITANSQAAIVAAMHLVLAQKQGADISKIDGNAQNDILKEYLARGCVMFPIPEAMRLTADLAIYLDEQAPSYWPFLISQYVLTEAGASQVQQVAYTLSIAIAYVDMMIGRGVDIDRCAPRLRFHTTTNHFDFFGEIAKLRAMRRLWTKIVRERWGAKDPRSMSAICYNSNTGMTMTRQQPLNNITRTALGTVQAMLAGVQRMAGRSMDEVFGIPSAETSLIVIRALDIINHETAISNTIDPLGGSYFIESLTYDFEQAAMKEIDRIDQMGGMVRAMEKGYVQKMIATNAYRIQQEIDSGERVRVGMNRFQIEEDELQHRGYRADPRVEDERIAELRQLRRERDNARVIRALGDIKRIAHKPESNESNLMPSIIEAVRAYATIGEICDALREVWGEYQEESYL